MFTLLGTDDCHLCDLAKGIVVQEAEVQPIAVYLEDISESPELIEQYGIRIPVMRHDDTGRELDWPFDRVKLHQWLTAFIHNTQ